jgi:hypothetical protein
MYGMEGDVIHGVYKSLIFGIRSRIASMAFEREVAPVTWSEPGLKPETGKISLL